MLRDPPSALPPGRYLRSTWILREWLWRQVEDRAGIPDHLVKLNCYVERAVFQYHPVRVQLRLAASVVDVVRRLPMVVPLCAPCRLNGMQWLPRLHALFMGGTRALHYHFDSTVVHRIHIRSRFGSKTLEIFFSPGVTALLLRRSDIMSSRRSPSLFAFLCAGDATRMPEGVEVPASLLEQFPREGEGFECLAGAWPEDQSKYLRQDPRW